MKMSYVDPNTQKDDKPPAPKKEPLFILLEEIKNAIEDKTVQTAHYLDRIATALEAISKTKSVSSQTVPTQEPSPQESSPQVQPPSEFEDKVRSAFPEELESMLSFDVQTDCIKIKPKRFLGSDNFAKIASIVRQLNGEYISAGKDSHFRIVRQ